MIVALMNGGNAVERLSPTRVPAAARLGRLLITSFHRRIMWVLGFVFFPELGNINSFSLPEVMQKIAPPSARQER